MSEILRTRPPCSLPMGDADKRLDNFNWQKGLQSESDWIWSGNLNPEAFPNNLGRFFLHIPGVFEQQLNYSTTLIFDEPSFRNGLQASGHVPRVARELVISFIAQQRRCQYSLTHHAVLGTLTARKHGLSDKEISDKWSNLLAFSNRRQYYCRLELAVLTFAEKFSTDPKSYSDSEYAELRAAFFEHNLLSYEAESRWLDCLHAARAAHAIALADGRSPEEAAQISQLAAQGVPTSMSSSDNDRKVNAQVVELAFVALQFVALTGVFSSLNVPDEDFLPGVLEQTVPEPVRDCIETILGGTTDGMADLVPPVVEPPLSEIMKGTVRVEPTKPRGTRIPLVSWEVDPQQGTRDKGLALGGVHVGVYGWSFGAYFPGSLTYALMHHGELARYEAPYSLPLLFNEDEWRNGTQTAGYNRPPVKELAIQKVYHVLRSRYGLEHHLMFFYNSILQQQGAGLFRPPGMTDAQHQMALSEAMLSAERMVLHVTAHRSAPPDTYSPLQLALLDWIEEILTAPHAAHVYESALRQELMEENQQEIAAGIRVLDDAGGLSEPAALQRLADHQIAEMAMVVCHMDGLARFLTILQLESELPVQSLRAESDPNGTVSLVSTGYMNSRQSLIDTLKEMGIPDTVLTFNELLLNPVVNQTIRDALAAGAATAVVPESIATRTAEF